MEGVVEIHLTSEKESIAALLKEVQRAILADRMMRLAFGAQCQMQVEYDAVTRKAKVRTVRPVRIVPKVASEKGHVLEVEELMADGSVRRVVLQVSA